MGLFDLRSRRVARAGLALLSILGCYAIASTSKAEQPSILPTLTTAAAVHQLSVAEAKRGYPVRLHAVCIICFLGWHGFFVNDGSGGVYVETKNQALLDDKIHTGSLLAIEGVTGAGEFSPIVDRASMRVLGEGALPSPRPVSLDRLSTGVEDGQWIEIEGTIRSADTTNTMLTLVLASGQLQVDVMTPNYGKANYLRMIDARVRVRGASGALYNQRRQIIGIKIYTPSLDEIRIVQPSPKDPFSVPAKAVRDVFAYVPGVGPDHRVRIHGIVTAGRLGEEFFITDGLQGAGVISSQSTSPKPGDIVDVIGFPALGDYTPTLHAADFRTVGSGPPPQPRSVMAKNVLSGDFDGDLIRIDARLIEHTRTGDQHVLLLDSGGTVFSAILRADTADRQPDLHDGSRLQLTGICTITETRAERHFRVPKAFQMLLRSPQDVRVLQEPPWWTAQHSLYVIEVTGVIVLCAFVWAIALSRQIKRLVRQRTKDLEESNERLHVVATHDGLTKLLNRTSILERLENELLLCARDGSTLVVALVDLDHFKRINDTHGHLAGDAVLREITRRFKSGIRPYDLAGRYGGEEFLLLLPGLPIPEAEHRLRQLQQNVCATPVQAGVNLAIETSCSFGVVCIAGEDFSLEQTISQADVALYRAKALGRNRIEYAIPGVPGRPLLPTVGAS